MSVAVLLAIYAGSALFLIGCILRIVQYGRAPRHLRWELYPVPHEEPVRAAHGGSYFETANWWQKPQHFSLAGEVGAMAPEMLFLKGLWEYNRRLWYASFTFHLGLYCSIATAGLVLLAAAAESVSPQLAAGATFDGVVNVYRALGIAATVLTIAGACLLLYFRLSDPGLKNYAAPADIFHLIFFIATFAVLAVGYALAPAGLSIRGLVSGLLTFNTQVSAGGLFGVGLLMASALAAYIPFTHMSHFIAKYFTYHQVRWDDHVNVRGGKLEAELKGSMGWKPTWSAPHVGANGERTWAEVASMNPAQEVRK